MKMLLPKSWLQICLLLWCTIMCFGTPAIRIMNTEKREVIVFFNNDGTLMDYSSVPRCESGKKINLVEYSYDQIECVSALASDCSSARKEKLLPEEELILHEECSLRNKCRTLGFPSRLPTLENKINAMIIKFQCIGQNSVFLDICEKRVFYFNYTLHLTLSDRTHFTDCRCWINSGDFTMILNDVRLTQDAGSKCSPAELVISNNRWVCHGRKKDGFGSMFHDKNEAISSLGAYVSLVRKSENISPDMVWLIIHPQETSRIECKGDYLSQNRGQDMTTPKSNLVRTTLTRRSMVMASTQTNIEQPEIHTDDPTARKSDNTWVQFFILIVVIFVGITITVYLVFQKVSKLIRSRKVSEQQGPHNTVKTSSVNNTNIPSSAENIPERQSHENLLLHISNNIEYILEQLRILMDEHHKQAPGQQLSRVINATVLQGSRTLVPTNRHTSEDNLSHRPLEFSSMPNFPGTETNKITSLSQKRHVLASDVTGRKRQPSESMQPVAEWNTERNLPLSLRRHSTYDSSGDGDETCCFKSKANSTDKPMFCEHFVLPSSSSLNLCEDSNIQEPIQETDLKKAPFTSEYMLDAHSSRYHSRFRENEMVIAMSLKKQVSDADSDDEKTRFIESPTNFENVTAIHSLEKWL